MIKKYIIWTLLIIAVLTLGLLVSLNHQQVKIYPFSVSQGISFNTMHEDVPHDFSKVKAEITKDSLLELNYELSKSILEPFAGVYFHKPEGQNLFFDFKDYDVLAIRLSSQKGKRIPIHLTINYKGITSSNKKLSSLPLVKVLDYSGDKIYRINKNEFEIPSWWLRYHGITKDSISNIDFSRIDYIVVNSCQTIGGGVKDNIKISSLTFEHSNYLNYLSFGIAVLLVLIVSPFVYFVRQKKVLVPYQIQNNGAEFSERKLDKIMLYIAENYSNSELSINDLQKDLGITSREIGNEIKDKLNHSFKSYLNTIRLAEVKRLLKESELSISEIAYSTGYGNISHFNIVFKSDLGISPKEYKEKINK